jgi:hypothetical protein
MSETEQEVVEQERTDVGYQLGDEGYVEGLGPTVFPPNVDPRDYPPHKLSPAEEAATVGRFVIDQVAKSPPTVVVSETSHEYATGRTVAAPQGTFWSRDETDPDAERGEGVSVWEAATAAQSEAVRSATPDMVNEEVDHLSDVEKGAKHGPFVDRKAATAGFGALDEATAQKLDDKHEEEVLARQGVKDGSVLPLSEPAKPATADSVEDAFDITEAAEDALVNDESIPVADPGALSYTPEEQVEANYAAQTDDATKDERQTIVEHEGASRGPLEALPADREGVEVPGDESEAEEGDESWNVYTVAELKTELDNREIQYDSGARKADLVALLEADDEAG